MQTFFLTLHLGSLAYSAWNIFNADHMGFDWMRGKIQKLDPAKVDKYHKGTWIGIILMIITGLALFWPERNLLLVTLPFYFKMAFVITIICNGFVIGSIKDTATVKEYSELTAKEKLPLLISGVVSTISWISAGLLAFFLLP